MAETSFFEERELALLGFKSIGKGCKISRKAQFFGINNISIGNNVRIDDFCIISGNITLGSNIHISAYVALYGNKGIIMEDYTGISARSTVYSAMDDFSGDYLVGPVHTDKKTHVTGSPVIMRRFSQIGAHCLVFPGVEISEGSVIGACSMVRHNVTAWGIYAGIPVKKLKERKQTLKIFV
ncbi:MAG: acyltransferase [Prevotella sp.]|nr:acyltransferase [Prevotella sp.]